MLNLQDEIPPSRLYCIFPSVLDTTGSQTRRPPLIGVGCRLALAGPANPATTPAIPKAGRLTQDPFFAGRQIVHLFILSHSFCFLAMSLLFRRPGVVAVTPTPVSTLSTRLSLRPREALAQA